MRRPVRWILAAAAATSAALFGLVLLVRPPPPAATHLQPRLVIRRAAAPAPPARPVAPPRPASLAGTDEDGRLTAESAGELVVDEELRRFLEYHLMASGEEPLAATRARLEAAFAARLPPRAAREARELLGRYLAMREAARRLAAAPDEDLDSRLARVRALRREHLGAAAAEAMFGAEEAEAAAALARRRGEDGMNAAQAAATAPLAAMRAEAALAERGVGVRELRVQAFGAAGAERLDALDAQRADWAGRVDRFRARRAEIEASVVDGDGRRAAVARALDELFAPPERARVSALERLAGRPLD